MKTKLLILFTVLFSLAGTCEADKIETTCNCDKVYYDYGVVGMNGVTPIWDYTEVGREPATDADCQGSDYVQIDNNSYYRIECE